MSDYLIFTIILLFYFSPVFYYLVLAIKELKVDRKAGYKKLQCIGKWSLIIILPVIVFVGVISHTNFLNYEKPIPFEKVENITFRNFRGVELFKKSLYGYEKFAYVSTGMEVNFNNTEVDIRSYFYPSRSFVYKNNSNSKDLLRHEIYHFKITELYVRKAKSEIAKMRGFSETRIKEIIDLMENEERIFQMEYDRDTFHSYVYGEQKKYERSIDSILKSLSQYKKPKINLYE